MNTPIKKKTLREIIRTQTVPDFWEMMKNRMAVGYYRHGDLQRPEGHGAMRCLHKKLKAYARSGNKELLIDIANCAMIEFKYPEHPNSHFKCEDRGEESK
jgi:hypothetical protein